jgi:hypothetical protein
MIFPACAMQLKMRPKVQQLKLAQKAMKRPQGS